MDHDKMDLCTRIKWTHSLLKRISQGEITPEEVHMAGAYLPTLLKYCGEIIVEGCRLSHVVTENMKKESQNLPIRDSHRIDQCKKRNFWENKGYSGAFNEILSQTPALTSLEQ